MDRFEYLDRRRQTELHHADLATCPTTRRNHEDQARAYSKIIDVLKREAQKAPPPSAG